MRPRHALAAAAILTAVALGSWATLATGSRQPAPQAAAPAPRPAPVTSAPAPDATINPPRPKSHPHPQPEPRPQPRPCLDGPAALPSGAGRISRIAGDFDGDGARDQLLAYVEPDAAGQPRQWHVRVVVATGHIADLALDNTSDWIGPNGLVARRAVDANGDGRDEGFVTSTGGASNDAHNLFGLAGCQLRQVRVAGHGPLRFTVGASLGHAEGFDCQGVDRHGRRLLALWGVQRAQDHPDGRSTYTWTKASYRWVGSLLVRQVDTTSGTFVAAPDDPLPAELTIRARPSRFAQQARSNPALRTRTNHHAPTLLVWCNGLLRKASWWASGWGSLDGMQGVRGSNPSAPPGNSPPPLPPLAASVSKLSADHAKYLPNHPQR